MLFTESLEKENGELAQSLEFVTPSLYFNFLQKIKCEI
jgi:hypothetical protein